MQIAYSSPDLATATTTIARLVRDAGGQAYVAGGAVRDTLLGGPVSDVDIEIYRLEPETILQLVGQRFELDLVGQSFGVAKVKRHAIDLTLPRTEQKAGVGHRGFAVDTDPWLPPEVASARRDFTINSMLVDPLDGELLDGHGGRRDLDARVLRHVSPAFAEDPLRVLRGAQFASRFGLVVAPETIELCRRLRSEAHTLAGERLADEWEKVLLRGVQPSRALAVLVETDWIDVFPELDALRGVHQDPTTHPEGDVFVHTGHVLDAFAARRTGDRDADLEVGYACLCHDLGKPSTAVQIDGRWRAPGHAEAGVGPTRKLLARLALGPRLTRAVVSLVRHHQQPALLFHGDRSDGAVRRLARELDGVEQVVRVARADHNGRPPLVAEPFEIGDWLLERAESLGCRTGAPVPLLQGRHLRDELGWEPGPRFGAVLAAVYEAQLDGAVSDLEGALALARAQPS